jgi:hypothetical protein
MTAFSTNPHMPKPGELGVTRWADDGGRCILFEQGEADNNTGKFRMSKRRLADGEVVLVVAHHKGTRDNDFIWVEVLAHDGIAFVDGGYIKRAE